MQKILKKNQGVTLLALIITIVVLLIIAGISVYVGSDTVKMAQLEELRSNMLLIEAKARGYVEEANFKMGINPDDAKKEEVRKAVYEDEAHLEKSTGISASASIPVSECYTVTETTMKEWGIDEIETASNEYYLIKFDDTNATVEVYNTLGYDGKYSLTEIDNIE